LRGNRLSFGARAWVRGHSAGTFPCPEPCGGLTGASKRGEEGDRRELAMAIAKKKVDVLCGVNKRGFGDTALPHPVW